MRLGLPPPERWRHALPGLVRPTHPAITGADTSADASTTIARTDARANARANACAAYAEAHSYAVRRSHNHGW